MKIGQTGEGRFCLFAVLGALLSIMIFCGCGRENADNGPNIPEQQITNLEKIPGPPITGNFPGLDTETEWGIVQYFLNSEFYKSDTVLVIMDKDTGGVNKKHEKSFFSGVEIEFIEDLTEFAEGEDLNASGVDWEVWRQILLLKLPKDSNENVLSVISRLEKIKGVQYAGPECYYKITGYYGTYKGVVAVMINGGGGYQMITTEVVADTVFAYPNTNGIRVWKEGRFFGLQEAYDLDLLTRDDIEKINDCHKSENPFLYEKTGGYH